MFCALLRDSRAETLLKTGQVTLLKHFAENTRTLDDYWPSVRIVLRNEYAIADTEMWCDYIDLLRFSAKTCEMPGTCVPPTCEQNTTAMS